MNRASTLYQVDSFVQHKKPKSAHTTQTDTKKLHRTDRTAPRNIKLQAAPRPKNTVNSIDGLRRDTKQTWPIKTKTVAHKPKTAPVTAAAAAKPVSPKPTPKTAPVHKAVPTASHSTPKAVKSTMKPVAKAPAVPKVTLDDEDRTRLAFLAALEEDTTPSPKTSFSSASQSSFTPAHMVSSMSVDSSTTSSVISPFTLPNPSSPSATMSLHQQRQLSVKWVPFGRLAKRTSLLVGNIAGASLGGLNRKKKAYF